MRFWLSGPRILGGLIRPGISFNENELRHKTPRLPNWRRHELRADLKAAAEVKGETITVADANYLIDKALAAGVLDANGDLDFKVKGTRDECIEQIIETSATWNYPMTGAEAGVIFDRAIQQQRWFGNYWTRFWIIWGTFSALFFFLAIHHFNAPAPAVIPSHEEVVKAEIKAEINDCKRLPSVYDWYSYQPAPLGETEAQFNQRIEKKMKDDERRAEIALRTGIYSSPVHKESLCGKTLYWREHDGAGNMLARNG